MEMPPISAFILVILAATTPQCWGCLPEYISSCVEDLPVATNDSISNNLVDSLLHAVSESKIADVCIVYKSALPCLDRRIEQCGDDEDKHAVTRTKRLIAFICAKHNRADRILLARSAHCIHRSLSAYAPSSCQLATSTYAEKLASCKSLCQSFDTSCKKKIENSQSAVCALQRLKMQCGESSEKLFTKLHQVMLANDDFPLDCQYSKAQTVTTRKNNILAAKALYRHATLKPKPKSTLEPITIPVRTTSTTTTTTPRPVYTRPTPRRPMYRHKTVQWNQLLARTSPSPPSQPIAAVTTASVVIPRPRTNSTSSSKKPLVPDAPVSRGRPISLTSPTPLLSKKSQPWRPFSWLSGARPIPDSILIENFLRWKSTTSTTTTKPRKSKGTSKSTTGSASTKPSPSTKSSTKSSSSTKASTKPSPALPNPMTNSIDGKHEWNTIQTVITPLNTTSVPPIELITGNYIRATLERMKASKSAPRRVIGNAIDKVINAVQNVMSNLSPDSSSRIIKGVEALARFIHPGEAN